MTKQIIIIGAGMAGLSAGCHAQINGFDTEIYEKNDISGGLCTSWKRKGYLFDGCLRWLHGSNRKSPLFQYLNELKIMDNREVFNFDEFYRYEENNKTFIVYTDLDILKKHMLELAPEDTKETLRFINSIQSLNGMSFPFEKPFASLNLFDYLHIMRRMKPFMKVVRKCNITIEELADKFTNTLIRNGLKQIIPPQFSALALFGSLAGFAFNKDGLPLGGSLKIATDLADYYLSLGGKIHYKKEIKSIILNKNRACGIELPDGTIKNASYIISATDGYHTIYRLLQGKYINKKITKLFKNGTTNSSVQISLGVDADLSSYPHCLSIALEIPVDISGIKASAISFHHFCHDPTMAPAGKSVLTTFINSDYDFWKRLGYNTEAYKNEKKKIANHIQAICEKRYPEIKGKIEVIDVATPLTYTRYCNIWKGSYMGWTSIPIKNSFTAIPDTVPGLNNFYLAGIWTLPNGGIPPAIITGRHSIQRICKKERIRFKTDSEYGSY